MGETFRPTSDAETQPGHRFAAFTHLDAGVTSETPVLNGEEEPYTIKCICGFDDDAFDGHTVFCEQCNTWQHIACYYAPKTTLLPDAIHSCIDCNPNQTLNTEIAVNYQKALRLPQASGEDRKAKRTTTKNHKKSKTRDLNQTAVHVNGNGHAAQDSYFATSAGGSPRDSAPPAKKHKTSHRPSVSTSNAHMRSANGRHRSASNALALANPQKPPFEQCPQDYLSPRFIQVHRENSEFNPAAVNLHLNFSVANLLSTWLDDEEAFAQATNGKTHSDVFMQFPQSIEELETPIQKLVHEKPHLRVHGSIPQWPYLVVQQDLVKGDFVGELRGCIGKREDYQTDAVNQWNKLRHPDHFVFFHPSLPIYIDARQEGTILRYARRSCHPNLKLETIITGAREYRFCFTALENIPRDTEITINWDIKYDTQLQHALNKGLPNMTVDDFMYVSDWVGNNLAHFGGCACENQPDQQGFNGPCLLATFDRRACKGLPGGVGTDNKSKTKRMNKRTPVNNLTHGSNSRASSEEGYFDHQDGDVEMADGRSTSQSTKTSRDATPSSNVHRDSNGNETELSERDKKKLAQQEKLFEQMENGKQQSGQKKKKRTSGSNVNTPIIITHRQSNRPTLSPSNSDTPAASSRSAFAPPSRFVLNNPPSGANAGRSVQSETTSRPMRAVYVDASTQTPPEMTDGNPVTGTPRKILPRSKQLLKRSLFQSRLRNQVQVAEQPAKSLPSLPPSPSNSQPMDTESSRSRSPPRLETPPQLPHVSHDNEEEPFDISQAKMDAEASRLETAEDEKSTLLNSRTTPIEHPERTLSSAWSGITNPEQPLKPPPPPWPVSSPTKDIPGEPPPYVAPVAPMHVESPAESVPQPEAPIPPPFVATESAGDHSDKSPPNVKRPTALAIPEPSMRNPESNSITKPSPVKKKMSLSDYMSKRNKPSTLGAEKSLGPSAQGSPLDSTSSPELSGLVQSPQASSETKG